MKLWFLVEKERALLITYNSSKKQEKPVQQMILFMG